MFNPLPYLKRLARFLFTPVRRLRRFIRNKQLRELYDDLYRANSEMERSGILHSWWLRGHISWGEDYQISRAAGVWQRVEWFERQQQKSQRIKELTENSEL